MPALHDYVGDLQSEARTCSCLEHTGTLERKTGNQRICDRRKCRNEFATQKAHNLRGRYIGARRTDSHSGNRYFCRVCGDTQERSTMAFGGRTRARLGRLRHTLP